MKTQAVRIADVLYIGPLMSWAGWMGAQKSNSLIGRSASVTLVILGVTTVLYNGRNYLLENNK